MSQHQRGCQSLGHKRPDQRPEAKLQGRHEMIRPFHVSLPSVSTVSSGCPHAFGVVLLPPLTLRDQLGRKHEGDACGCWMGRGLDERGR